MPLPRKPNQIWALKHEESPKNNDYMFSHEEVISLFNYTSTFKRQSDYPLSTQHLPNLDYLLVSTYTTLTTRHKTTFFHLYIYGLEIDILQSVETLNPY